LFWHSSDLKIRLMVCVETCLFSSKWLDFFHYIHCFFQGFICPSSSLD
jgi:hypothetical protein